MPEDKHPHTEHSATAYNRLQRLQEHSRTNIPAMMAHRSTSTFTLHQEPLPAEANDGVLVAIYAQNPFLGEPEVRVINANDIAPGLINSRVRVQSSTTDQTAEPDEEGNYLFWPGDPRFDQVNVFYFTTFTLRMYERYARRALPWAFPSPRLNVDPHAGNQANAFYNEQDRLLGFHAFETNGDRLSTAHSADIIAHEAAHAVLDGLRDLYNESFGLGASAFHEGFADITSMLVALHDDSLVRRLLDWTDGDLRMDNFVTQIAENLTLALLQSDDIRLQAHNIYLRNAFNDLKYKPFDELVYNPPQPEFTLGRQPHNYSRLLTGAFYDIFAGIYEKLRHHSPPHIAIYRARDICGALLIFTIEIGPVGELDYTDIARCALTADDILYKGRFQSVVMSAFVDRGILPQQDAEKHIHALRNLPDIMLPPTINSALASALFLEKSVLPALKLDPQAELIPMAAYRNGNGYAFFTYFATERITLDGPAFGRFEGAHVDLFGGMTLAFDPSGRLRSVCHRPIRADDQHQVKVLLSDLIAHNLVTEGYVMTQGVLTNTMPEAFRADGGILNRPDAGQLIKYPVMHDEYPISDMDITTYLEGVKVRLNTSDAPKPNTDPNDKE